MSDGVPGWNGTVRADGARITLQSGDWVIEPANKRPTIRLCPCCEKPMRTPRAAKLVCDRLYPLQEPQA